MLKSNTGRLLELQDERARHLDAIDDILETARSRVLPGAAPGSLSAEDQAEHDYHVRRLAELDDQIAGHATRSSIPAPNVIRGVSSPRSGDRTLTELLWATADTARAGTLSETGQFHADPTGATVDVDAPLLPGPGNTFVKAPRLAEFGAESHAAIRAFQATVAEMAVAGLLVDRSAKTSAEGFDVARSLPQFADRWAYVCRAMDVDTSGEGGTWVPTGIGAAVHEKVRAMGRVAPLFARIDLPTNPWKWPIEGADAVAYRVAEPTGDTESKFTGSTPGTVAATFDAEIFGARVLFSRSVEQDAAVAMAPYVVAKIARAFSIAEERAILDGDTDGTHQDSDVGASTTDTRTAWDGLRKRALANASVATTATTVENLRLVRKAMGKWGVNPSDLAFIIGVQSAHAILADTNLLTVDKFGPNATVLAGQVGSVLGAPVIVSEYVREDLNASGVHDGITTTKSFLLCVNRSEWAMGQRMALDIAVDDSIYRETFQRVAVGFARQDFQNIGDASSNDDTAIGYNITSGS